MPPTRCARCVQTNHTTTYPAQPWSTPYGPVDLVPGVRLEAWLEDTQGRFNLNNLVKTDGTGATDEDAVAVLQNLLTILGLEPKWAQLMADWVDADSVPNNPDGAEDSVYPVPDAALSDGEHADHQRQRDSGAAGIWPGSLSEDRPPFLTALPPGSQVNLCSARIELLNALGPPGNQQLHGCRQSHQEPGAELFSHHQRLWNLFSNDADAKSKGHGHGDEYFQFLYPDEYRHHWHHAVRLVQFAASGTRHACALHTAVLYGRLTHGRLATHTILE